MERRRRSARQQVMHPRARSAIERLRDERGVALILALVMLVVLSTAVAASLEYASSGSRNASLANARVKAYALAEAGVNAGASVLAAQARPDTWTTHPEPSTPATQTYADGSASWYAAPGTGTCSSPCAALWTITATSSVANPTGPSASAVTRAISKTFEVDVSAGGFGDGTSFLYGKNDVFLTGGSATEESIITDGDLVLSGSGGSIDAAASALSVRGTISAGTSQDFIGDGLETTLTAAMNGTQTAATVANTADFPSTGWIKLYNEYMRYSGKTATSFTGLTRGAFGSTAASHSTTAPDNIVSGSLTASLTTDITATSSVISVTSLTGLRTAPPSGGGPAGLLRILNAGGGSVEYVAYTGVSTSSATCGAAPCFTGLTRGYVPGFPAAAHTAGTPVDARIQEIHTVGGCITNCSQVEAAAPIDANLIQDQPTFVIPTFGSAQARNDAAPGPNHQPAACPISFATSGTSTQQSFYYNGATVDLTPSTDYDCTATSPVYGAGELKWRNATGVLKIRGVVFIPSNVKNSQDILYDAPNPGATLYVSGKYTSGAGTDLCGLRSSATLTAPMNASQNFANVVSTVGFPTNIYKGHSGTIQIDNEQLTYSDYTANSITGLARGKNGTTAAAHSAGAMATETAACDVTNWNPNTGNNLALVGANLPAGVPNSAHDFTFGGGSVFQGLVYTDGSLTVSGGGILSGTAWATGGSTSITYSGGAAAPAPGILKVPFGFPSPTAYTVSYVEGTSSG